VTRIDDEDIGRLTTLLNEIDTLPASSCDDGFKRWRTKTGMLLASMFGETSALRARFGELLWANAGFDTGIDANEQAFNRARERAKKILAEALDAAIFMQRKDTGLSQESGGEPVAGDPVNDKTRLTDLSPMGVLNAAIKAVPAVRFALGVGGIAAVVAIVVLWWKLEIQLAVFGTLIVLVFMVVLVIFSALSGLGAPALTPLALVLAWAFLILTVFAAALFASCAFFDWPKTLPCLLRGECAPHATNDNDQAKSRIPPLTSNAGSTSIAPPAVTETHVSPASQNCPSISLDRSNDTMGIPGNVFDGYGTAYMERRPEAGGMWTATGGGPFHVGWIFPVACAGRYTLKVAYASEDSRASEVVVNNSVQLIALSHVTNTRAQSQWFVEGTIELSEGMNRLRFHRDQPLPNIDAVKLEKQ